MLCHLSLDVHMPRHVGHPFWKYNATRSNMPASLEVCTREEQCAGIRFLGIAYEKPADIHHRMKGQYRDTFVCVASAGI